MVQDPAGDVASPAHDIVDVKMADVFGGTFAGKFKVIVDLATTAPPGPDMTGAWIVSWDQPGGDTTMTLTAQRCEGGFSASYTFQSDDASYSSSGSVDDFSYENGRLQFIVSRDKFGNLPPGSTLTSIAASSITTESVPPLGCVPTVTPPDVTASGTYTLGSCTVAVPAPRRVLAIQLGPALPNPARRSVRLTLGLPDAAAGRPWDVAVFDATGGRVRSLASGSAVAGSGSVEWDLRGDGGVFVAAGRYWIRARIGESSVARAVVVTR